MRRTRCWAAWVLLAACWAAPQAQDLRADQFEVASIKPDADRGFSVRVYPGGRVLLTSMTLKSLVALAFRHNTAQVTTSAGDWIENDTYTVEAKPSESAGITNTNYTLTDIDDQRLRGMLQALLIDRFKLRLRRETRTGDAYQLLRTSKALALQPATVPEGRDPATLKSTVGYAGGRWVIARTTMPQLASFASKYYVHAPVVDQTGLGGAFDYRQQVRDAEPAYAGIEHTSSFLRMIGEVGLELKRSTGPVEWLVIDSAARPSPN